MGFSIAMSNCFKTAFRRRGQTKWVIGSRLSLFTWLLGIPSLTVVYLTLGASYFSLGGGMQPAWQTRELLNAGNISTEQPVTAPNLLDLSNAEIRRISSKPGIQSGDGGFVTEAPRKVSESGLRTSSFPGISNDALGKPLSGSQPEVTDGHVVDGTWLEVPDKERRLYLYSAFYDDRPGVNGGPVIRVLAMVVIPKPTGFDPFVLTCHVTCKGRKGVSNKDEFSSIAIEMPKRLVFKNGTHVFFRYLVTCQTGGCERPGRVTIRTRLEEQPKTKIGSLTPTNSLPVEYPDKPESMGKVALCLPLSFGHLDPYRLIEWVELQKILGVEKILVYNDSLDVESLRLFDYYRRQGLVEIRQCWTWFRAQPDDVRQEIDGRSAHSINDCMYRNMYSYHHLVVVDVDEIILPSKASGYSDLIHQVRGKEEVTKLVANYRFRHAEFLVDPLLSKPDPNQSPISTFLRYRQMLPLEYNIKNYHMKSIIDPRGCTAMHNHICRGYVESYGFKDSDAAHVVDPMFAMDRHYRNAICPPDTETKDACKEALNLQNVTMVRNDDFLQFESILIPQMNHVIGQIGLNGRKELHREQASVR